MSVSAAHFKEVTNGYEKRTDGLWVHGGKLSVGPPGMGTTSQAGDLSVNRGANQGAIYFGGLGAPQYIYFDGTKWVFQPGLTGTAIADGSIGTADLAPGAAQSLIGQYFAVPGFSSSTTNVWLATPITTGSIACSGAIVRIEAGICIGHSALGGAFYTGLMVDNVLLYINTLSYEPLAGAAMNIAWTMYYGAAAGNHMFTLGVNNATVGTLTTNPSVNGFFYVTEQRR